MNETPAGPPAIVVAANAFWNIANFRSGLIERLVSEGYRVCVACPDPDRDWATAKGVEALDIQVDRSGVNPFTDVVTLIQYGRLMRRLRPSYFLGFTAKPNIYGSIAAGLSGAVALPNVSGLGTAFIDSGPLSAIVGGLYRLAFRSCSIVFFQNSDDRDLFVERKIVRSNQARLLPGSGVDLRHFTPQRTDGGSIRFLFVGRLLGDKGVREFVEAARLLKSDHPGWVFQLLGPLDPDNRSGIPRQEVEGWVADGVIEYLGAAADIRPHVAGATAVVLPSYREGLPRSLLEAAAMARPLIASDVPGNRQIVKHGINGLLCEARDAVSLAAAMRRIGELGQDERTTMGQAGRRMVEQEFDEERVIQAYLDAMAPALGARAQR